MFLNIRAYKEDRYIYIYSLQKKLSFDMDMSFGEVYEEINSNIYQK